MDIVSLRRQLREHCGMIGNDTSEIPDVDTLEKTGADTYLNRSYWELLDKFKFREKEVIASFPTVVAASFYHTPASFEAIQNLAIVDLNDDRHKPLDRITADVYAQKFANRTDSEGKPTHYFRESDGIRLWPTPDDIYTLEIRYWTELADLTSLNIDPEIPRVWHEVILFGGIARALLGASRDHVGAQAARAWQDALISGIQPIEAKEEVDSHRSGLEVLGLDCEL